MGFVALSDTAYETTAGSMSVITWERGACYAPGDYPRQHEAFIFGYPAYMYWDSSLSQSFIETLQQVGINITEQTNYYPNPFIFTPVQSISTASGMGIVPQASSLVFDDKEYTYRAGRIMKEEHGCPPGQEVFAPPRQVYHWEVIRTPK